MRSDVGRGRRAEPEPWRRLAAGPRLRWPVREGRPYRWTIDYNGFTKSVAASVSEWFRVAASVSEWFRVAASVSPLTGSGQASGDPIRSLTLAATLAFPATVQLDPLQVRESLRPHRSLPGQIPVTHPPYRPGPGFFLAIGKTVFKPPSPLVVCVICLVDCQMNGCSVVIRNSMVGNGQKIRSSSIR